MAESKERKIANLETEIAADAAAEAAKTAAIASAAEVEARNKDKDKERVVPTPGSAQHSAPAPAPTSAPTTTSTISTTTSVEQQDLTALGQRRINMIWEMTQSAIALMVVGGGMFTASILSLRIHEHPDSSSITAFLLISNTVFLVLGFYFSRTNHQNIGGVGSGR